MPKKTVLIIDDDIDILSLLQRALEAEGYHVLSSIIADNLPIPQPPQPDLILLDVMLSGGENGLEICKKLKQQSRTQHIPVILISAHASLKIMASGQADGWLAKPFDLDTLFDVIETHLVA